MGIRYKVTKRLHCPFLRGSFIVGSTVAIAQSTVYCVHAISSNHSTHFDLNSVEILSNMNLGLELKACPKSKPSAVTSPIEVYKIYLKSKYRKQKMPHYGKWPNLPAVKYVNMAVIEKGRLSQKAASNNSKALTYGDINAVRRKSDITFSDIAKPSNEDSVLPKLVLLEGAPGVGKTTFAWEACRKWAEGEILQDFNLVILVRLRDQSVRSAQCLGDLIQYPRDPKVRCEVIEEITKTGGQGVLILLEGYDELPASLREHGSLYRKVIQSGAEFDEGTVLVTSRPWASEPFLLPHRNSRPVEQHVEILGFTAENIVDYISSMLYDDPSLLKDMKQYLELCPHIHSMMYIPLNCAIILEVYRNSKEENSLVPKTMTELYSSLIRSLLLRYTCDLPEYEGKVFRFKSLQDLPTGVGNHLNSLAKLAYHGILEMNQQIIFSEDELPSDFNSLGLMQSSMELYVDVGASKSYNFLHLTIQEFLAAYHISTFFEHEKAKFFSKDHEGTSMVVTFLAGLSPTTLEKAISFIGDINSSNLEYTHWLFEAKLKPRSAISVVEESALRDPFTSYVLGYFISNSNFPWKVIVPSLRDTVRFFVCGLLSSENKCSKLELSILLDDDLLSGRDAAVTILSQASISVEKLNFFAIIITGQMSQHPYSMLTPFLKNLADRSPLIIKHLVFDLLLLTNAQISLIRSYLEFTSTLTGLTLNKCIAESADAMATLAEGLQACKSLKKLFYFPEDCSYTVVSMRINKISNLEVLHTNVFSYNDFLKLINVLCDSHTIEELVVVELVSFARGLLDVTQRCPEAVDKLLKTNTALKAFTLDLYLTCEDISVITSAMCDNSTLQKLSMPGCFVDGGDISTMLRGNQFLKELTISVRSTVDACVIAKGMCQNTSLEKLTILFNFSLRDEFVIAVEELAYMLKHNQTLKELQISCISINNVDTWTQCCVILTKSLRFNKTLTSLILHHPPFLEWTGKFCLHIDTEFAGDNRLTLQYHAPLQGRLL